MTVFGDRVLKEVIKIKQVIKVVMKATDWQIPCFEAANLKGAE